MSHPARAVLAAAVAVGLAACGTPSADLFVVERTGAIPGARLSMRVSDGGQVACNGRPLQDITSAQLIEARALLRDLDGDEEKDEPGLADKRLRLPAGPGSVLSYAVRTQDGVVVFSDTSPRQPAALRKLAALTRELAKGPCGLAR